MKKMLHFCLFVLLISYFVGLTDAHTIVNKKCPSENIYSFDIKNFVSGETQKIETDKHYLNITHFDFPEGFVIHELKITPKNNKDRIASSTFEGIVFELNSLELDGDGYGKEFLVTDKPSARGYQYSIMPSASLNSTGNYISKEFKKLSKKNINSFWSLPESYYPMFTDIDDNGVCEILSFSEIFQYEFMYPNWYVNPNVYSFDSVLGQVKLNIKLNKFHIDTLWDDQKYKFNRLTNLMKSSKSTSDFLHKMPEFDFGIQAIKYLYSAKQVDVFESALRDLEIFYKKYKQLEITDNLDEPPIYFHLASGKKFEDLVKLNKKTSIFSDKELDNIRTLYEMIF